MAIVRVEFPVRPGVNPKEPGFTEATSPFGDTARLMFKVTLAVVSPRLCTVNIDDVELPATILPGDNGPATIVKSGVTVTRNLAV